MYFIFCVLRIPAHHSMNRHYVHIIVTPWCIILVISGIHMGGSFMVKVSTRAKKKKKRRKL